MGITCVLNVTLLEFKARPSPPAAGRTSDSRKWRKMPKERRLQCCNAHPSNKSRSDRIESRRSSGQKVIPRRIEKVAAQSLCAFPSRPLFQSILLLLSRSGYREILLRRTQLSAIRPIFKRRLFRIGGDGLRPSVWDECKFGGVNIASLSE